MPYFSSRNTLYAHAKGKSANFFGIVAAHFQHARMNHTAAENFQPAGLLTHPAAMTAALRAGHIHFRTRLREREEAWTQTNLRLRAEHLLYELQQRPFRSLIRMFGPMTSPSI